jgi:hypothetical protein
MTAQHSNQQDITSEVASRGGGTSTGVFFPNIFLNNLLTLLVFFTGAVGAPRG